jgi:hypothetical protein
LPHSEHRSKFSSGRIFRDRFSTLLTENLRFFWPRNAVLSGRLDGQPQWSRSMRLKTLSLERYRFVPIAFFALDARSHRGQWIVATMLVTTLLPLSVVHAGGLISCPRGCSVLRDLLANTSLWSRRIQMSTSARSDRAGSSARRAGRPARIQLPILAA